MLEKNRTKLAVFLTNSRLEKWTEQALSTAEGRVGRLHGKPSAQAIPTPGAGTLIQNSFSMIRFACPKCQMVSQAAATPTSAAPTGSESSIGCRTPNEWPW
jgi:hypothetical protein